MDGAVAVRDGRGCGVRAVFRREVATGVAGAGARGVADEGTIGLKLLSVLVEEAASEPDGGGVLMRLYAGVLEVVAVELDSRPKEAVRMCLRGAGAY